MRHLLSVLTCLAWALWLGGLIALFILVSRLFATDRLIAVEAAPRLFVTFERYQLILAALGLVAACAWRLAVPSGRITLVFTFLAIATVGAAVNSIVLTPRMEAIRAAGQSSGPEFKQLHGRSMVVFMLESASLLLAGVVLPHALAETFMVPSPFASRQTERETARATDSPA